MAGVQPQENSQQRTSLPMARGLWNDGMFDLLQWTRKVSAAKGQITRSPALTPEFP